jgi:hypothetical protein
LVYEDRKLFMGAVLSGLGLLAWAGLWWQARRLGKAKVPTSQNSSTRL